MPPPSPLPLVPSARTPRAGKPPLHTPLAPICLAVGLALVLGACSGDSSTSRDDRGGDGAIVPDAVAPGTDTPIDAPVTAPDTTPPDDASPDSAPSDSAPPDDAPTDGSPPTGTDTPTPLPEDDAPPATDAPADKPVENAPDDVPTDMDAGTLAPLPSPALTEAPDAGDEPLPLDPDLTTATRFTAMTNPPWTPPDPLQAIDEQTFFAGLREPIVHMPPGHDPARNRPPLFPDLDNVTVEAGSQLELHLAPIDPDGGVAGQYPKELPPGARYIDNFDTTRTLVWRPLEPDVGIREFTIFTNDPVEPDLRVEYTVLIRVVMPNDPSSIENRPPGIDRVRPLTARVGDPVVIGLKGTDPNGTIPRLEVGGLPPDATIRLHPDDARIRVVRFVPDTPGTIVLDVLAIDAVDPSLTARKEVIVNVHEAARFTPDGPRLRELADARGFLIGHAAASNFHRRGDGALYAAMAAAEFNAITPENAMKWDTLNPEPGRYRWAEADNMIAHARANDMQVYGHTLVWYTQLPSWIKEAPAEDLEGHMREHIDRVLTRYADDVPVWDVVNEALDADGGLRRSIWLDAMGPDYIDIAFRQARASAPEATLIYNDYDVGFAGPKGDGLIRLLESLRAAGTPIDGVGFQMHVFANFGSYEALAERFRRVAALDLDIYITELDVSMRPGETEGMQASVFENVLSICLAEPRCKALQNWGFTDRYSWRRDATPLPFDAEYLPKPAYRALQRRLGEN